MNLNNDIKLSAQAAQMIADDFKRKEESDQKLAFIKDCLQVGAFMNRNEKLNGDSTL